MSAARMIELAVAVVLLGAGVYFYRGPKGHDDAGKADTYGSQGAVIMFVVAAIMAIHALGGLDYHPSAAQADLIREPSQ
jgi:hypothetical protein